MRSHQEAYPEQYNHPMCGVRVTVCGKTGVVERVFPTRFGMLVYLIGEHASTGYLLSNCIKVKDDQKGSQLA